MPVVFDHFGGLKAAAGLDQPGFADLVELVHSGHAYVKISTAYRASTRGPSRSRTRSNQDRVNGAEHDRWQARAGLDRAAAAVTFASATPPEPRPQGSGSLIYQ
jgi:hypothetical protein